MKQNVGKTDKIVRIVLGIVFVVLGVLYSYYWFIPALVALGTAFIGWCGLYTLFGINTCKMKSK
jgi:hypothetical protein